MSDSLRRGRGRPALVHDNRRVQECLSDYPTLEEFLGEHPRMDDVLTGAVRAQTTGHTATRPLPKKTLFVLLSGLPVISTSATSEALRWCGYCETTIKRYAQAARMASLFISRELDREAVPVMP